jgi:uncharacterized membrane protein
LLTGLGIILIIAHNWDNLPKIIKLTLALAPLLTGQVLCVFTLLRKENSSVWRASSVFLVCAIAASISIVSQVYNIAGDLGAFLLVWMMLSLPLIYIMRSRVTSLLVICGITWYVSEVSYFNYPNEIAWYYWPMIFLILPFYYQLYRHRGINYITFHSWLIPLSLTISLGMFSDVNDDWMNIAYACMFSMFVLVSDLVKTRETRGTLPWQIIGTIGVLVMLLTFSFEWSYRHLDAPDTSAYELQVSALLFVATVAMLVIVLRKVGVASVEPAGYLFVLFTIMFLTGLAYPIVAQVGCNLIVLATAVVITKRGSDQQNLLILNFGLLTLAALVACRFFDTHISFVIRGVMFIAVGFAFFAANFYTLKKRKTSQA